MRNNYNQNKMVPVIVSALFVALLIVPTLLYLTVGENSTGNLNEKRKGSDLPTEFSNMYFHELEDWYNDHAPYRLTLITLQKAISQGYGAAYRHTLFPVLSELFSPSWYRDPEYRKSLPENDTFLAPLEENGAVYGRDDWMYYTRDENIRFYTGDNLLTEETMHYRKEIFQELARVCEEKEIRLVVFLAPGKSQVYGEYMPSYCVHSGVKRGMQLYEYMKDSGVSYLYPLQELIDGRKLYDTYYKQDTHWNEAGGYIGAVAMLEALNVPTVPLDELNVLITEKNGGDLTNFTGYASKYEDYIVNYKPEIEITEEINEDGTVEIFTSNADTSADLVVVGDSFRLNCRSFLAKEFHMTTVAHSDTLEYKETVKAIQNLSAGDALIVMRVERYDELLAENALRITEILKSAG